MTTVPPCWLVGSPGQLALLRGEALCTKPMMVKPWISSSAALKAGVRTAGGGGTGTNGPGNGFVGLATNGLAVPAFVADGTPAPLALPAPLMGKPPVAVEPLTAVELLLAEAGVALLESLLDAPLLPCWGSKATSSVSARRPDLSALRPSLRSLSAGSRIFVKVVCSGVGSSLLTDPNRPEHVKMINNVTYSNSSIETRSKALTERIKYKYV